MKTCKNCFYMGYGNTEDTGICYANPPEQCPPSDGQRSDPHHRGHWVRPIVGKCAIACRHWKNEGESDEQD